MRANANRDADRILRPGVGISKDADGDGVDPVLRVGRDGKASKIDTLRRFNKSLTEMAQEISSRNPAGVANVLDWKLDEDEYGGEDMEITSETDALRRWNDIINMEGREVTEERFRLSEGKIEELGRVEGYRKRGAGKKVGSDMAQDPTPSRRGNKEIRYRESRPDAANGGANCD